MTLHKEHRTPRTFNCLGKIVTPNKSESKTKRNRWKTQSDFVKRKIVPEIYMSKNKLICKCVSKLRTF